jgi:hypothetical protein
MPSAHARPHLTLVRSAPSTELAETAPEAAADRRLHPRHTAADLEWLSAVRLKYGPAVALVDLSTGGAQIETTNFSLQPGSTIAVQIVGSDHDVTVPSNVLRCQIARVAPHTIYRTAIAFRRAFEPLRGVAPRAGRSERAGIERLLDEHARLAAAMARLESSTRGVAANGGVLIELGDSALAGLLTAIHAQSGPRSDPRFRHQLAQCLGGLVADIESGAAVDMMVYGLADRLRRSVPATSIHVQQGMPTTDEALPGPDTIYFAVPGNREPEARLVIEFPPNCPLERWHLQLLKTAAHLVALIGEADRLRTLAACVDATALSWPDPSDTVARADTPPGWERLVVRYLDGRLLKGYSRTFLPGRGNVTVLPQPVGGDAGETVSLSQLKAIFFVHDLNGAPADIAPTLACTGRRIAVTFKDGEELRGATLNYTATGPGFFVWPDDPRSNNARVFVVNRAVLHAQFL